MWKQIVWVIQKIWRKLSLKINTTTRTSNFGNPIPFIRVSKIYRFHAKYRVASLKFEILSGTDPGRPLRVFLKTSTRYLFIWFLRKNFLENAIEYFFESIFRKIQFLFHCQLFFSFGPSKMPRGCFWCFSKWSLRVFAPSSTISLLKMTGIKCPR